MRAPGRTTHRALLGALVLALAGCGAELTDEGVDEQPPQEEADDPGPQETAGEETTQVAEEDRSQDADASTDTGGLAVVSTVAPIADVVAHVLGDRGTVEALIPANMDSHSYEPRPGDVAPLTEADLFIGNGLHLNDAAVALAEANLGDDAPVVLLGEETLSASDLTEARGHDHDDGAADHDHDEGHDHDHDHDDGDADHDHDDGDGDADHDHAGVNPHVWTSVAHVRAYVGGVEEALSQVDPDGAEYYTQQAEDYRAELDELDEAIRESVASVPEDHRKLVVYHDAWRYFGDAYGLEVVAAVQPSDFSEPSAADVRAMIDQVRAEDVPAVFGSEEFASSAAATIADETGAQYVGDLADDELPGEPGDPEHSYVGMMTANAVKIADALGGSSEPLEDLPR